MTAKNENEGAVIHIINGPNLNMLGNRESKIYGLLTLKEINLELEVQARHLGLKVEFFQSNHEGAILDYIQDLSQQNPKGIIINPGAFTHTSIALRDALLLLACPIIEVHLSNIHKREPFRRKSMVADIALGQITGFGHISYQMALRALHDRLA